MSGPSPETAISVVSGNRLADPVAVVLNGCGVMAEPVDAHSMRFVAVPVSAQFNKPRTNLLLQRLAPNGGSHAYVDGDLAYGGAEKVLQHALTGPAQRDWRRLRIPPIPGSMGEALCMVLVLLGSPIAEPVLAAVGRAGEHEPAPPGLGPVLSAVAEAITPEAAAEAHQASLRKDLAVRLAVITTRATQPNSAVLWGPAGAGRDHLMLAAAHLLLEAGVVDCVLRVAGGVVGAGCIFPAEMDSALLRLLAEASTQDDSLFLIQDLDVCISGSPVSFSLLCSALDRGLRFLATVRTDAALARLGRDEALARRLVAVRVDEPTRSQVADALARLAASSSARVAPEAIVAAMNLARQQGGAEPAASLGLLGAAIADAQWRGDTEVHPDGVFAVASSCEPMGLNGEWPDEPSKE